MPNYQNGKIYCIRSFKTNDIYIGSTTQPLCKRIDEHRQSYKTWIDRKRRYVSSFELIKHGDAYIELIFLYPCISKEELKREEGKYQREVDCVNRNIAGRTKKEWLEDNKEHIQEYMKEYKEKNKEKEKEYMKEYKEKNREKKKEYMKEWHRKNKEKAKEKYTCECGSILTKNKKSRHEKTKKHINFINNSP